MSALWLTNSFINSTTKGQWYETVLKWCDVVGNKAIVRRELSSLLDCLQSSSARAHTLSHTSIDRKIDSPIACSTRKFLSHKNHFCAQNSIRQILPQKNPQFNPSISIREWMEKEKLSQSSTRTCVSLIIIIREIIHSSRVREVFCAYNGPRCID